MRTEDNLKDLDALIVDPALLAMARSDATFDGRNFDGFGRAEKLRYLSRCAKARAAAQEVQQASQQDGALAVRIPGRLVAPLREIADWRRTGDLSGVALRAFARKTQSGPEPDIRRAEDDVLRALLDLIFPVEPVES